MQESSVHMSSERVRRWHLQYDRCTTKTVLKYNFPSPYFLPRFIAVFAMSPKPFVASEVEFESGCSSELLSQQRPSSPALQLHQWYLSNHFQQPAHQPSPTERYQSSVPPMIHDRCSSTCPAHARLAIGSSRYASATRHPHVADPHLDGQYNLLALVGTVRTLL